MGEDTLEKKRTQAKQESVKSNWIGKAMKELHEELEKGAEVIELADYDRTPKLKFDPVDPPPPKNWLKDLAVGTSFLTTERNRVNEPELIKATIINHTENSTCLMLTLPTSQSITLWVNTATYSRKNKHMDTL